MRDGAILILEGGDCAGKSTLAAAIAGTIISEGGDFLYLHGSPWPGTVEEEHNRMETDALRALERGYVVVLDHFWIAEQVYGAVYRDGPAYDPKWRDDLFKKRGALIVLCAPSDLQAQIARHAERRKKGLEHFEDARKVVTMYSDLARGNLAHPGDGYIDKFIRHQDFRARKDVLVYDMDFVDEEDVPEAAKTILAFARKRHETMNTLGAI